MHDRNMLWKAHDFLAYARQPRTAQTSIHHPDAGNDPCPFNEQIQYRYLVLRGIYLIILYFTDFHVWFIMDKERVTA